jgi:UDP-glucose 4-epimerase
MILVTGAAGFIGSQIVHTLSRLHDQPKVIGVDDLSAGYTCNLPHDFECFMGNVGHREFMGNLIHRKKVTQIIHCAASISVPASVANPQEYYDNNVLASYSLIKTAIDHGVDGFVFSSSAAVYGQPDFHHPTREDDACRPCSPYGWSKMMTERMLQDLYPAHHMNTVILRYFNVAGADPLMQTGETSPASTHLIKKACQSALGMKGFTLFGDGYDRRDYVHVADVADANILALQHTARHNGCLTLNVGTGQGATTLDVLNTVNRLSPKPFTWTSAQRREGDPVSIVANTNLIRDRFNWTPKYSLVDIVEHALKWEKTL